MTFTQIEASEVLNNIASGKWVFAFCEGEFTDLEDVTVETVRRYIREGDYDFLVVTDKSSR